MDPITALSVINTVGQTINHANDAQTQQNYQLELMSKQHDYNTEAMQQQVAAQKELYNYTGYASKVAQLKEAGLNPALVYAGGAGMGGVTGNTSAPQVSQGSAPNVAQSTSNKIAQQGMLLQLNKMQSEIDLNKSQANLNEAAANIKTGVETQKTVAETANIQASTDLIGQQINSEQIKQTGMQIDNTFKQINTEVAASTQQASIDTIVSLSQKAAADMQKTLGEAQSADAKGKVDQATIDTMINQYNANVKKTLADILVANSQNNLNQEKATEIVNSITQRYQEIKQRTYGLAQGDRQLDIEVEKLKQTLDINLQNNNAAMDRLKVGKWFDIANTMIKTGAGAGLVQ